MVASSSSIAERFVPPPEPFLAGRWRLVRFTRNDMDTMLRDGIIPEDASIELLHGLIVLKDRADEGQESQMVGKNHTKCVELLSDLRTQINTPSRHVRSQQPLVCSETHVPEPDFMVLRRSIDDYDNLPSASDAWCVVEVADASYDRDAGEKLIGYALAGIAQYIILNLRTRTAEVYTNPNAELGTYPAPQVVGTGGLLALRIGEGEFFECSLSDLMR